MRYDHSSSTSVIAAQPARPSPRPSDANASPSAPPPPSYSFLSAEPAIAPCAPPVKPTAAPGGGGGGGQSASKIFFESGWLLTRYLEGRSRERAGEKEAEKTRRAREKARAAAYVIITWKYSRKPMTVLAGPSGTLSGRKPATWSPSYA